MLYPISFGNKVSTVKLRLLTCSFESTRRGKYGHYFTDASHIFGELTNISISHLISSSG